MSFQRSYLDRLQQDIDRWIAAGHVAADRRELLLADAAAWQPPASRAGMAAMLTLLGALLMGAGAIAFVAANWAEMGRLARVILLFASMGGAFGAAWWFMARAERPQVGQGLILLGVILFGASIHLIAQTYQIEAHYPNGVLLWAAGALLAAAVVPSAPSLWLGFAVLGLWSWQEMFYDSLAVHLPFLPAWAAAATVAVVHRWWRCLAFGILLLAGWYGLTGLALMADLEYESVEVAAVMLTVPLALWVLGDRVPHVGGVLHGLGVAGSVLGAAVALQPEVDYSRGGLTLAAAAVAAGAAVAAWAWARPSRLRLALAVAVALAAPLRLLVEASPLAGEAGDWVLMLGFLALVIALAVLGGREGSAVTRRIAYAAFGLHVVFLYTAGLVSLLSLFVVFTVVGSLLVVAALRMEKRA